MSLNVKIKRFQLKKCKGEKIAGVEFRGKDKIKIDLICTKKL